MLLFDQAAAIGEGVWGIPTWEERDGEARDRMILWKESRGLVFTFNGACILTWSSVPCFDADGGGAVLHIIIRWTELPNNRMWLLLTRWL